ncbi:MAG: hypothetical protein RLZZ262_1165 [Bacteroidota bacterium]
MIFAALSLMGALAISALMGFVEVNRQSTKCWNVDVRVIYKDSSIFLTQDDVQKSIRNHIDSIQNFPLNEIDLNAIHRTVVKTSAVKTAGVYTTVDGRCVIEVEQRVPVVRIFNSEGQSFYMDAEGYTFPASYRAAVRLPVFTGHIPDGVMAESYLDEKWVYASCMDDILRLANFIRNNAFWSAQIEQVYLNASGNFEATTRVGDHQVIIGDANNLELKFRKWMAFYANTIKGKDLNQYKTINLKFDGQVVCAK